jgi:adenosylhomocysteine nucleosidase
MGVDILVVASSRRELAGFPETGQCGRHSYATASVGVGKVQSAVLTMQALETYRPDAVLCVGYAGAVDPSLKIGDCVLATSVVQYDMDLRSFSLQRGEVPDATGTGTLGVLETACIQVDGCRTGVFGTADRFLLRSYREQNPWLLETLHLSVADMESYAVAFACKTKGCPCTVCRVVSDDANGHRPKRFARFGIEASKRFAAVLEHLSDQTE